MYVSNLKKTMEGKIMKSVSGIGLSDVQAVYSGAEGKLWELIMGEQIHIGGFSSSMDLAEHADIGRGMRGVDFCCCNGAGMRFLVRFCGVDAMTGVDATETVVEEGRQRCEAEGLSGKISFVLADVCESFLESESADFVWGEDAWCYVVDKEKLITEAARIVKPGGVIAFTDWVEGQAQMSEVEAERYLRFMKFANVESIEGYKSLLEKAGCELELAEDTGRFGDYVDLYLEMVGKQLTYDVLKIIGFNTEMMQGIADEMSFMSGLGHADKIAQGIFVARKKK
jgi:ubiquinone/menaquinone biosynthesis C-methylase UbiE